LALRPLRSSRGPTLIPLGEQCAAGQPLELSTFLHDIP
jgi:hypothetical protein